MSFGLRVDLDGFQDLMEQLGDEADNAARPAAYAATKVLYDEVQRLVGTIQRKTGNLARSIYHTYSEDNSGPSSATYHISWNARKAPHGHLVEFGHIQRYASYVGSNGNWYTAVRQEMQGKPRPKRRASQAVKDAYYVLRPGGEVHWMGHAFIRRATAKFPQAQAAAEKVLLEALNA